MCLRKRPLMHTECRRGEADVVTTPSGECVIVHESKEAVDLSQYTLQVDNVLRGDTDINVFCLKLCFYNNRYN